MPRMGKARKVKERWNDQEFGNSEIFAIWERGNFLT